MCEHVLNAFDAGPKNPLNISARDLFLCLQNAFAAEAKIKELGSFD